MLIITNIGSFNNSCDIPIENYENIMSITITDKNDIDKYFINIIIKFKKC